MTELVPCLWFADDAEEAVRFYVSLLPDSHIDAVQRSPTEYPGGPAGGVLVVSFTLCGRPYMALNGGKRIEPTIAVSFSVNCDDQAEIDRLWLRLGEGGREQQCGWITDRWGYPWQIVPKQMPAFLSGDPARAARVFTALMGMVKIDLPALERAAAG